MLTNPTVNYRTNPIGIETMAPEFSWKMKSDVIGKEQKAYRIRVSRCIDGKDTVWDSGRVESGMSVGINYSGAALDTAARYYWTATVWDESGKEYSTEQSFFETGVTEDSEWVNTPFIQVNEVSEAAPIFRTEGSVDGEVINARLYATAAGVYDAYINGEKAAASDGGEYYHMAPGYGNGRLSIGYQAYDVTPYIKGNRYAIAIQAGTGWSNIKGEDVLDKTSSQPAIKAMMTIDYLDDDGEKHTKVIKTNTSDWRATFNGPITASGVFYGEDYDARKEAELGDYKLYGYDDSAWNKTLQEASYIGNITADRAAAGKIIDSFEQKPVSATIYTGQAASSSYDGGEIFVDAYYAHENADDSLYSGKYIPVEAGKEIFDDGISLKSGQTMIVNMGQNLTAIPEIGFKGTEGGTVTMTFGEMLNDGSASGSGRMQADGPKGSMYKKSLRSARSSAKYTFAGDDTVLYQPSMSFFGYQYIEIKADCDITIYSLRSRAVSSISVQTGSIETNNDDVNRLFKNALFGQLSNSFTTLTDCPQRDERRAWTGDAQAFAQTAVYNFDAAAFMNGYQDALSEAVMNKGYPGSVLALWDYFDNWASGWSDVEIINAWTLYLQTGDVSILENNWTAMKRYMNYLESEERAPYCAPGIHTQGFGDWLAFQGTGYEVIADYYYGYVTSLMVKIAEILDDSPMKLYYSDYFNHLKETFLKNHVKWNTGEEDEENAGVTIIEAPTISNPRVSNVITNKFKAVNARYVRITATRTGPGTSDDNEYRLQMMELELSEDGGENYALGKTVSATDTFDWENIWNVSFLTDGSYDTGYTSANNSGSDLSAPISVTVDLGESRNINQADIYCRIYNNSMTAGVCPNYPAAYELLVSEDGENWTTVGKYATEAEEETVSEKLVIKSGTGSAVM